MLKKKYIGMMISTGFWEVFIIIRRIKLIYRKRIGIGWDVNIGNPIGMTIMIVPFVLIFIMIIVLGILGV